MTIDAFRLFTLPVACYAAVMLTTIVHAFMDRVRTSIDYQEHEIVDPIGIHAPTWGIETTSATDHAITVERFGRKEQFAVLVTPEGEVGCGSAVSSVIEHGVSMEDPLKSFIRGPNIERVIEAGVELAVTALKRLPRCASA